MPAVPPPCQAARSTQEFHEDLFPDCVGTLPATGAQAWWAGDSQQVGRVSLHPTRRSTATFSSPVIACTQLQAADASSTDADADRSEGPGPEGGRGARLVWVCGGDYLLVSGFDSRSERRILLYRAQALPEGPLSVLGLDVAPSTLLPFYDEDTSVVFLTGKGDTRVFLYEVTPEPPYFLECNSFTSSEPHKGFVFLPKTVCEVREVEFARALRLGQSTLEPVAFHVPRVKKEYFQDDIYPPTRVWWEPALGGSAWLARQDGAAPRQPAAG
ncbi:PREDICTED: coronin-7 [Aptenodytes forsteri]|uniref:coronin-7 n=1 Tax=Aptenodytes forsteri TaxID=9233 RepID=UPI0004F4A247|nr:PREDICTED: coronin-7 [Aptenodytes forsteri]